MIDALFNAAPVRTADAGNAPAAQLATKVPQVDVLALWQDVFDTAGPSGEQAPLPARDADERRDERRPACSEERDVKRLRTQAHDPSRGGGEDREADSALSKDVAHSGASMPSVVGFAAPSPSIEVTENSVASGFTSAERSAAAGANLDATEKASEEPIKEATQQATQEAPLASMASRSPAMAVAVATLHTAATNETSASLERPLHAAPDELPAAESVRVFQDAAGLQIVVRHAGLSAASAIECAMETARQLTGDRRALQQVVLNGRSVYASLDRSPPPSGSLQSGLSSRVVFRC